MPNQYSLPVSRDLLLLLLIWCGAVALVYPMGDFPLNDDWAYAQNTRALAVENRLYFSDWPAMTLIAHTLWGTLFCKLFGFSFTVLRFSTLLMALFGIAGFYRLSQWLGMPRQVAIGCCFLLAFNPLWFSLANSYMTDVPFLATLLWSTFFFLKTLEKPAWPTLAISTFFCLWACFIRQLGLLVPGIFLVLFLYHQPIKWRYLFYALTPVAVCFIGLEAFSGWLKRTGQLPEAYRGIGDLWHSLMTNTELFSIIAQRVGITLMTAGLFLLPLTASSFRQLATFRKRDALILLPGAYCIWSAWALFPVGNVFFNLGLGPKLLNDAIWGVNADPKLPESWFLLIKCAAVVGAASLLLSLWPNKETKTERHHIAHRFSLLFCIGYTGFICLYSVLIDRHLLPFVPFLLLSIGIFAMRFTGIGLALLVVYALFSIVATHDYLAWNRARWQAANQLLEQKIPPEKIDGGFEFNGWHLTGTASQRVPGLKSWWFVRDDEWIVSFGPIWGYDAIAVVPYQRWLPPGTDTITVNRRKKYVVLDSLWCDMERLTPDSMAFVPSAGHLQPGNGPNRSAEKALSGQFSLKLTPSEQFGATTSLDTFRPFDRLIISVWRYPVHADAGIVVAADDAEKAYFFEPSHIIQRDSAGWGLLEMAVTLPASAIGSKGKFYIWNPSSAQTVWFDDLKVYRLRSQ